MPSLGRFLQPDLIGYSGGLNLYAYVDNDPLDLTDPSGMEASGQKNNPNQDPNPLPPIFYPPEEPGYYQIGTIYLDKFRYRLYGLSAVGIIIGHTPQNVGEPMFDNPYGNPAPQPVIYDRFNGSLGIFGAGITNIMANPHDYALSVIPGGMEFLPEIKSGEFLIEEAIHYHHIIPVQVLRKLPKEIANNPLVRGFKGSPNRIPIPASFHRYIHSKQKYNDVFMELLNNKPRKATLEQVLNAKNIMIKKHGLGQYMK